MFWSQRGAEELLSIHCLIMSPHFEAAWNARQPILASQRQKARRWSPLCQPTFLFGNRSEVLIFRGGWSVWFEI